MRPDVTHVFPWFAWEESVQFCVSGPKTSKASSMPTYRCSNEAYSACDIAIRKGEADAH